jgi:hypothetical protein
MTTNETGHEVVLTGYGDETHYASISAAQDDVNTLARDFDYTPERLIADREGGIYAKPNDEASSGRHVGYIVGSQAHRDWIARR